MKLNSLIIVLFGLISIVNSSTLTPNITFSDIKSNKSNNSKNVFIIAGGYNAANNGELGNNHRVFPGVMVWNSDINEWTEARYPLPGADSKDEGGGSIWGWFGNGLYNTTNKTTYLIDIARSDSNILDWIPSYSINDVNNVNNVNETTKIGKYYHLLSNAISVALNTTNNPIILWQEGETDARGGLFDSIINYEYYLSKLVESTHYNISWGISISAYSPNNYIRREQFIRDSQRTVISKYFNRTFAGPKSDVLCIKYRYNKYYFNIEGLQMLGKYWVNSTLNRTRLSQLQGDICDYHTADWGTYFVLWCSYALLFILVCLTAVMISWYISGRLNHWFVSIPYHVRREQQPLLNQGTIAVYPPEYKVKDDSIQDTN